MFNLEEALTHFGVVDDPRDAAINQCSMPARQDPRINILMRGVNELSDEVLRAAERDDVHRAVIADLSSQARKLRGLLAFIAVHGLDALEDRRQQLFAELGVDEQLPETYR